MGAFLASMKAIWGLTTAVTGLYEQREPLLVQVRVYGFVICLEYARKHVITLSTMPPVEAGVFPFHCRFRNPSHRRPTPQIHYELGSLRRSHCQ